MTEWRFGETAADGDAWLNRPDIFQVLVDYRDRHSAGGEKWQRITVVTLTWLESQLRGLRRDFPQAVWVGLPPLVVIPDGPPSALRAAISQVVESPGIELYSTELP